MNKMGLSKTIHNPKKFKTKIQGLMVLTLVILLIIPVFSFGIFIDLDQDFSYEITKKNIDCITDNEIYTPNNLLSGTTNPPKAFTDSTTRSRTRSRTSTFSSKQIHTIYGGSLAGGIVGANLDEDIYQEIIVIGGTSEGRTTLIEYDQKTSIFTNQTLWWDPNGGLVTIASGDVDTSNSIPEILVGGYSGNLTLLYYNGSSKAINKTIWQTSPQDNDTAKLNHIWSIAIGDVDAQYVGNEIIVTDAATNYVYILSLSNSNWIETRVYLEDIPRTVYIGDFDMSHEGNEILVLSLNGTVYRLALENSEPNKWSIDQLFKDRSAAMSAVIMDINQTHPGSEVIIAGLTWNTTLIWGSGSKWYNKTIWHASGALEGMSFGDFDELHDGPELCIAGYSNSAVMLYEFKDKWKNELIFHDPNIHQTELNGVLIHDIYPEHDGNELVVVGFQGPVWLLEFEPPGFDLDTPKARKEIEITEFTTFKIDLLSFSGYNSSVQLQLTGLPNDITYSFSRQELILSSGEDKSTESSVLTIDTYENSPTGEFSLQIVGEDLRSNIKKYLDLTLIINAKVQPADFELSVLPSLIQLNLSKNEYYAEFNVKILPINQFDKYVELFIDTSNIVPKDLVKDLNFTINPSHIKPGETSKINVSISKEFNSTGTFEVSIIGGNTELDLVKDQDITLQIIKIQDQEPNVGNGNSNSNKDDSMYQWVGLGFIGFGLLLIIIFMLIQTRRFSRSDEKRRSELREQRQRKTNSGNSSNDSGSVSRRTSTSANTGTGTGTSARSYQRHRGRDELPHKSGHQFNKRR